MTVRVWIDGWPYLIESAGTVEVERMFDGETVAIRGERPVVVKLDQEELDQHRQVLLDGIDWASSKSITTVALWLYPAGATEPVYIGWFDDLKLLRKRRRPSRTRPRNYRARSKR